MIEMRKGLFILITIALLLGGGYAVFMYVYVDGLHKKEREWHQEEYVDKSIQGVLERIVEYEGDAYKITLAVKNRNEEFDLSIGSTCVDANFREFVAVGDSVFKEKGENELRFCKSSGGCKEFELNFCGRYE
jgi:hypothetical protein